MHDSCMRYVIYAGYVIQGTRIKREVPWVWPPPRLPPWPPRWAPKGCWAPWAWWWTESSPRYDDWIDGGNCCLCGPLQELLCVALLVGLDQLVRGLALVRLEPVGDPEWAKGYRLASSYISFSALLASCWMRMVARTISPFFARNDRTWWLSAEGSRLMRPWYILSISE